MGRWKLQGLRICGLCRPCMLSVRHCLVEQFCPGRWQRVVGEHEVWRQEERQRWQGYGRRECVRMAIAVLNKPGGGLDVWAAGEVSLEHCAAGEKPVFVGIASG